MVDPNISPFHAFITFVLNKPQTTGAEQVSVTVNNSVSTMHVGDLDGWGVKLQRGNWKAMVTITVHDTNHDLVPDATVTGNFYQNGAN